MFLDPQFITLEEATSAIKLAYLAIPFSNLAMTCVKASVALTLFRIPLAHAAWRPLLLSVIAVQTTYFVGHTIYNFAKCRPLRAAWDITAPNSVCLTIATDVIMSNIGSSLNITTDVLLSLAPMAILWKLRRPRRERILVCCLTGVGLLATGASVAKAVFVGSWDLAPGKDMWAVAMSSATWTIAEQYIAVFAACSPSLKGPIEAALGRFGILLTAGQGALPQFSFVQVLGSRIGRSKGQGGSGESGGIGWSVPIRFKGGDEVEEKMGVRDEPSGSGLPTRPGSGDVLV
jgi:hypothetical protein